MPDLTKRSYQKELLDGDDILFDDIKQNMQELDVINTWLGGHQITIKGFQHFISRLSHPPVLSLSKDGVAHPQTLQICEIGCGGGDNLRAIQQYCKKKNINIKLIGIDINPHCIAYAHSRRENEGIEFICSDYSTAAFTQKPDIIFSSLFCHHFSEDELQFQFMWMKNNSTLGFFVNDLHRHVLAYYSIKLLTNLFSKSYLVKNDAPLSVARGFKREELIQLCDRPSINNHQLKWMWAFRWLLIYKHD
ncbi:methyltransferase domain-containing protein [Lacibacter sediminis]|uniref:Methyltransferase domain-containing protein n=1 Tax=Lacibacter sediminis TaxID=2760713 RepID=A0A7G5XE77_9BACT|nr:methyltransferase domain-containing protein [Lacibacter sediminis]QNA43780.1 methyltransferase domain-containing protein [Lacibacter sediminis]